MQDSQALERTQPVLAAGKRALMEAALRLTSTHRSLSSISLRELAREAGLNPNTFYRHFKDIDDLGLSLIRETATLLRGPLQRLRAQAAEQAADSGAPAATLLGVDLVRSRRVSRETVRLFFDFVAQHPERFIIGVRELNGPSASMRQALRELMQVFACDMADDVLRFKLLPDNLSAKDVLQISVLVTRSLFEQSLDYLDQAQQREAILNLAQEQIVMLFSGAALLKNAGQLQLSPSR